MFHRHRYIFFNGERLGSKGCPVCPLVFSFFFNPGATEAQEGERQQRHLGGQPCTANFPRPV